MAKKNEQPEEVLDTAKEQPEDGPRDWFFPTLGVTVNASSYEEALELATRQKEEEEGDANV